jgi:hypothetical protein
MADHQWFYIRDSMLGTTENVGPVSEEELFALARDGKLKKESLVSSHTRTNGAWHSLQQIPGLLKVMEQGEQVRTEERERQARAKEAEQQSRAAEQQRQAEVRQAESARQAEIASQQREVLRQQREQEKTVEKPAPRIRPSITDTSGGALVLVGIVIGGIGGAMLAESSPFGWILLGIANLFFLVGVIRIALFGVFHAIIWQNNRIIELLEELIRRQR